MQSEDTEDKTAEDIMTKFPETVEPSITLLEAAKKMDELDVGFLPICENEKISGVVTDRDIVLAIAHKKEVDSTAISEISSKDIITCNANDPIETVSEKMKNNEIRRVLVLDNDKLVGVISLGDLANYTSSNELKAETLKQVS